MARPRKQGLDYFPFDVTTFNDIKVRKLIKYQGGKAVTVYALLLCLIYKSGYYIQWDEELPFVISELTGFEEAYIREVINVCLTLGLFSNDIYRTSGVLTSRGIQIRFKDVSEKCRRTGIVDEYSLISSEDTAVSSEETPISSEETSVSSAKTPVSSEFSTQRKENKRKENKKKSIKEKTAAAHAATLAEREMAFYESIRPFAAKYPVEMLRAFFDYWSEPQRSGTKMRFELQPTWELSRRLATWHKRECPTSLHTPTKPTSPANTLTDEEKNIIRQQQQQQLEQEIQNMKEQAIPFDEYKKSNPSTTL